MRTALPYLVIPSVSRGIPLQKLKGNVLGFPRLTLGTNKLRSFAILFTFFCLSGRVLFGGADLTFESGPKKVQLLELFTSEGCSSCPPAEASLSRLRDDPRLWRDFVPVAFHVDYWDRLGWKDPFASFEWTKRQQAYAENWKAESVYTPAFVLNGREWHNANVPAENGEAPGILKVMVHRENAVMVKFEPINRTSDEFEVYLARLAFGVNVNVRAGENNGRNLRHDFVVLSLTQEKLDQSGKEVHLSPPELSATHSERNALAVWITRARDTRPVQATGGWLP